MNPIISNIKGVNHNDVFSFTLSNINVSLANAIRRIILSEIPTLAFITELYNDNLCNIIENTSRLHNEILKQRLGCIPIHEKDLTRLPDKYVLELNVTNDTENIMYVTTEHFKIKNKIDGTYLSSEETQRIFPKNDLTNYYIDFARLRPKISDTIPGETIALTCDFGVSNAKYNSMYNVVSKCTYSNSPDNQKILKAWDEQFEKLNKEGIPSKEIEFHKKNFMILDKQRYFIPDSFDFEIQTVGVYDNIEIVKKACELLSKKFDTMIEMNDADTVPIINNETTMDNSFDIILENEDYTMGKVLEYILYENHYQGDKTLSFCGFKKMHPHDNESIIRIAFTEKFGKTEVKTLLTNTCKIASDIYKKLYKKF
jgi:DNA-directed RNA polymerase alpha subunit